jgi:hypothetical protein
MKDEKSHLESKTTGTDRDNHNVQLVGDEGPIFRRLIGRGEIGDALHPGSIVPIFKRVAQWIGMPARFVAEVSGHSTRVGAAQDLAELDIDLVAITQAGGWKSPRMPLQYPEKINAARSGMARAAAATGRDKGPLNRVGHRGRFLNESYRRPKSSPMRPLHDQLRPGTYATKRIRGGINRKCDAIEPGIESGAPKLSWSTEGWRADKRSIGRDEAAICRALSA